ncbi:MAG: signal recognition particle-docking protein FtsY [Bacteroidetes bacterium]|nr:signal recognition particle-docking protein FtsY [Bacteroidota bacterium]
MFSISKIREGFNKTRNFLKEKLSQISFLGRELNESELKEIEEILILSDFGYDFTKQLISELKNNFKKTETENTLQEVLQNEIIKTLNQFESKSTATLKPKVILLIGVNGVGKTTTIAKLANIYKKENLKVIIGAADTFRVAANEQLNIWTSRLGIDIVQQKQGADPGAVAYDTVQSAIAKNYDIALIDTAGRLHTKNNLMDELSKIGRVIKKIISDAPHEIYLVIDASTGQNGIEQAKVFSKYLGLTGIIITKLDGTAKGGIVVNIVQQLKIPIKFIGVGESIDDLQEFDATAYTNAIFNQLEEVK